MSIANSGSVGRGKAFEPWLEFPHIWKTESAFWGYVRGAIRKAFWYRSPAKLTFKNKNCSPPPKHIQTRAKTGAYCALSGEWVGKSKLEVDHVVGNMSLRCEEDMTSFIKNMILPGELQLVSKPAHKIKSYADRHNISYEEAVIAKKVIQLMKKKVDIANKELLSYGFKQEEVSNAVKRKAAYTQLVRDGRIQ